MKHRKQRPIDSSTEQRLQNNNKKVCERVGRSVVRTLRRWTLDM